MKRVFAAWRAVKRQLAEERRESEQQWGRVARRERQRVLVRAWRRVLSRSRRQKWVRDEQARLRDEMWGKVNDWLQQVDAQEEVSHGFIFNIES